MSAPLYRKHKRVLISLSEAMLRRGSTPISALRYAEQSPGPVAFAGYVGPYEGLGATHAVIERWIEENGFRANGAPWEWYVTDPGEHPDPTDYRTEVYDRTERWTMCTRRRPPTRAAVPLKGAILRGL